MQKSSVISTMVVLFLAHFIIDFMFGIWSVYKTIAHLDIALAGIIAAIASFCGEGSQIVFGSLSDRPGYRKKLLILGLLLTGAATLYVFTTNYLVMFFLLLLTAIGSGSFHPTAVGLVSQLSKERKGLFITIFAAGGSIGMAVSQWVFTHSFYLFNGNTWFLIIPAIALILYAFTHQFPLSKPLPTNSDQKHDFKSSFRLLRNPIIARLYCALLCFGTVNWAMIFLLPDILISRNYPDWLCYGTGHFFMTGMSAIAIIPAGYLADKYSSRVVILFFTFVGIAALYTFVLFPRFSPLIVLGLLCSSGCSAGVMTPVSLALGNRLAPAHPGAVSALLMGMVWCIAECIGLGAAGLLSSFFQTDAPATAMSIIGILMFLGGTIAWYLPKTATNQKLSVATT
jgi:FSR family fosmidomycin resistance protein-like MFS transporter